MWPGVGLLPDFLQQPPQWKPKDLSEAAPLDDMGLDLLARMLRYDPVQRISAKQALCHPFITGDSTTLLSGRAGEAEEAGEGAAGGGGAKGCVEERHGRGIVQGDVKDRLYAQYGTELRNTLLALEGEFSPAAAYKTDQHLKGFAAMRKILVEWLVEASGNSASLPSSILAFT